MMDFYCTKPMLAHWGVMFEDGKWYKSIDIKNIQVEIITDKNKYFDNIYNRNIAEKYLKYINVNTVFINDNFNKKHQFIIDTEEQLLSKLNIKDLSYIKFRYTYYFLNEYFLSKREIRQQKINKLKL